MAFLKVSGANGADYFFDQGGEDVFDGGVGRDTVYYTNGPGYSINMLNNNRSVGFDSGDTFISIEDLFGSNFYDDIQGTHGPNAIWGLGGPDQIYGWGGDDELYGGDGNDRLFGGLGSDLLVGGDGIDEANYGNALGSVSINLTSGTGFGAEATGDVLSGIENVSGSAFGDLLRGDAKANVLWGAGGGDILIGEGGDDELNGSAGNDILNGGPGNDRFVFYSYDGSDIIADFDQSGDDVIVFKGFQGPNERQLSVNDLSFTAMNSGSDTLVTSRDWPISIYLQNTTFASIGLDDFIIVPSFAP